MSNCYKTSAGSCMKSNCYTQSVGSCMKSASLYRGHPRPVHQNLLLHSVDEDLRGRPADAIWLLMACSPACISCILLEGCDCNMPTFSAWLWLPNFLAACFR